MKGLFYFAHPYTSDDKTEEDRFERCCRRSGNLLLSGYNLYSPIAATHPIHLATPELRNLSRENMWRFWTGIDNHLIGCVDWDGLILAPGWEASRGCTAERQLFEERGLPILRYEDLMIDE